MGSEKLFKNNISSENIENRNRILNADKKYNQYFLKQLDNEFSKYVEFDKVFDFRGNTKSVKEDFVVFHSTVEGKYNTKIYTKHINSK